MKNINKTIIRIFLEDGSCKEERCEFLKTARRLWNEAVDRTENPVRGEWVRVEGSKEYLIGYINKGEYFTRENLNVYR